VHRCREQIAVLPRLIPNIADCLHDLGPCRCFRRSSPDSCLLISVTPEKFAHLSHKFRATEEDSILNLRLPSPSPNVLWLPLPATVDERHFGARIASLDRRTPRWTRCRARRVLLGFQRRKRRELQWYCSKVSTRRRATCVVISCAATSRVSCPPNAAKAADKPQSFSIWERDIRRENLRRFPYHFLFRGVGTRSPNSRRSPSPSISIFWIQTLIGVWPSSKSVA
jgi:hypothetical protein